MEEWKEFSDKTVEEALTKALVELQVTSDKVEYEILEKESSGILGLFSKPARIRVRVKYSIADNAVAFLENVFRVMELDVSIKVQFLEEDNVMSIDLSGEEMGILIGKRGATLDSLQYLVSLVVNKKSDNYIKVKLDTENYRERRKETLENLAKNIAHKVKRIHRPVFLEPMNPYERRVIHSTLQNDKFVETHSEGEEPFRKVVVTLKPGVDTGYEKKSRYGYSNNRNYTSNAGYHKKYRDDSHKSRYNETNSEQAE